MGWPHASLPRTEWIRPQDVRATHGMGRTLVYDLMRAGLIQSACIRRPGKAAGVRLVNVASLNAYITSQLTLPPTASGEASAASESRGVTEGEIKTGAIHG